MTKKEDGDDIGKTTSALKGDPDDPRDDGDGEGTGGTGGEVVIAIVGVIVAIFAITSAVGVIKSTQSKPPPAGTTTCTTSCYGLAKLECPTDRLMGPCFGFWGCGGPQTHTCGTNP